MRFNLLLFVFFVFAISYDAFATSAADYLKEITQLTKQIESIDLAVKDSEEKQVNSAHITHLSLKRAFLIGKLWYEYPETQDLKTLMPLRWEHIYAKFEKEMEEFEKKYPEESTIIQELTYKYLMKRNSYSNSAQLHEMCQKYIKFTEKYPDFKSNTDILFMIYYMSINFDTNLARETLQKIAQSKVSDEFSVGKANTLIKMHNSIGKSFNFNFFDDIQKKKITNKTLKGKVTLLVFWGVNCGPCRQKVPELKMLYERYKSKGLEIVGIYCEKDKQEMLDYVKKNDMQWPQFYDNLGFENEYAKHFGLNWVPEVMLLDKNGILRAFNIQYVEREILKYL